MGVCRTCLINLITVYSVRTTTGKNIGVEEFTKEFQYYESAENYFEYVKEKLPERGWQLVELSLCNSCDYKEERILKE